MIMTEEIPKSELVKSLSYPGHALYISVVIEQLGTDIINGLTEEEAEYRLKLYGPNVIPIHKGSFWQIYLSPLVEWLIVAYLVMTSILIVLSIWDPAVRGTAIQWLVIVIINFGIAIFQQFRAQKKITALQKLSAVETRVYRDGHLKTLSPEELVTGDVIEFSQGNRIPADCRLISSANMLVDESSLTGESLPVAKLEYGDVAYAEETPVAERSNMVFNGTFVTFGWGRAIVVNTGARSEIGKISVDLGELSTGEIPLRSKVNKLGKYLTFGMIGFLIITLSVNLWRKWDEFSTGDITTLIETLADSIITAMAIMPINIPLLTTIVLITGVLVMATYGVVISNLSAVESLGRASILCSDKTGTITRSQMTAKRIWDCEQHLFGVTGLGYGPSGVIFPLKDEATIEMPEEVVPIDMQIATHDSALEMILISGLLNNDAELIVEEFVELKKKEESQLSWKATGSPTDAALIALFKKSGLDEIGIRQKYKQEREYPFDSRLKRMSKVFQVGNPGYMSFTKGAAEILLPLCTKEGAPGREKPFPDERKSSVLKKINSFAALGFRVIVFTYKKLTQLPSKKDENERDIIESDLTFLGFVCLSDPPREGVKESVTECTEAGITTIMITGDSAVTGAAIAREVGILEEGERAVEGNTLDSLNEEEFKRTAVFARVSPKHKQIIIERYQDKEKVCGMTGDGINDALALSMADAGIVMGITGTDVAKQSGDLIVTDDSFNSIVTGIRQGRGLFQKIRIMIFFYICVNIAEALVYFLTSLMGLDPKFLEVFQRMYIFGFVHALPPMAIIFDRLSGGIMERDPIDTEGIFNARLMKALVLTAIPFSIVMLTVYFLAYYSIIPVNSFNLGGFLLDTPTAGDNQLKARTMFLTVVYLVECILVLSIRRIDQNVISGNFSKENRFWLVYVCVFFFLIVHLMFMYVPVIQEIIYDLTGVSVELMMLDPFDWLVCIVAAAIPLTSLELYKAFTRYQGKFF